MQPTPIYSGKVRDIYDAGQGRLLLVTSDRVSAFDVVLNEPIPDRGKILTAMTEFWLKMFSDVPSHLISTHLADFPADLMHGLPDLAGRSMLVHKAEMLKVEAIVRGNITGSGWKDYQRSGSICGILLPSGLQESEQFAQPIFTPSTKADEGHDENISFEAAVDVIEAQFPGRGQELMEKVRARSLELFSRAAAYAKQRGIVIADTKFEWGLVDGELVLCDEVLTPDSSRFWPADEVFPGATPPSFDKQIIRNYLQELCDEKKWDKSYPPPPLPSEIIERTAARYKEGFDLLRVA